MHIYAADVSALAESVAALTVVGAVAAWVRRTSTSAVSRLRHRRHEELVGVLSNEVASGPGWEDVTASPEVSIEAGIAYARAVTKTGHPPYVPTQGFPSADDPLDHPLDKTAETVWAGASSAQSELEPYLKPVRNYLAALAGAAGIEPARDFALGVLTERGAATAEQRMSPGKGLLLCSSHHAPFDAGILDVSADWKIVCRQHKVPGHRWTDADQRAASDLHGQQVKLPADTRLWPSGAALAYRAVGP